MADVERTVIELPLLSVWPEKTVEDKSNVLSPV